MVKLTKEFTFDTAHMLAGHEGMCRNLHGHTYKLYVTIMNEPLQTGSSKGMVMDFKDLKEIVNELVVDLFDHSYMYDSNSIEEIALATFVGKAGMRTLACDFRTTCENLSEFIYKRLSHYLPVHEIKLHETPTSYAVYGGDGR